MKSKQSLRAQSATFGRLWHYLGKDRKTLVGSILLSLVSVVSTLYVPVLVGGALDAMVGIGRVDFRIVANTLWKIGGCIVLTCLAQWCVSVLNQKMTYRLICHLRRDAFAHMQKLPLSYFDTHKTGDTVSRIITDVDQMADGLLMGLTQFASGIFTILITLIFMLWLHPVIAVIVVVLTPLSLLIASFIAKRTYHMFSAQSKTRAEQTALMEEMVRERKTVSCFGYEQTAIERFEQTNEHLRTCSVRATFFSSLTNPCTRVVNALVYAAVALTGALCVMGVGGLGALSVGALSSFLSYANRYTKPFNEISGVLTELQNSLACCDRIMELLDAPAEMPEAVDAVSLQQCKGAVTLQNVSFSYRPEQTLLSEVNVAVQPGQRVAIVGPTGCGKTTLINLLMRFYDVNAGAILVDGVDIRTLRRADLRAQYGMVLQDTWLKHATVRENLKMGRPDATDAEMIAVAKESFADSFIRRLPKGYDTVLGEEGSALSQGQKQLLCIARVMLCLPPMLILDEATSSIDTRTEQKIQKAFSKMMQGRTSFVVAHRLTTICDADWILVMRNGQIVEQGTHKALLAQKGFYAQLFQSRLHATGGEIEED